MSRSTASGAPCRHRAPRGRFSCHLRSIRCRSARAAELRDLPRCKDREHWTPRELHHSFVSTDVQLGSASGGDRADSGVLEHKDHRGGLQAQTAADPDDRRRGHGQPYMAPPPPCPARAGEAPGTRSSTPRSPGHMPMATSGSRSISTPLTRCPGHSGSTPASARPDTASGVSSTAARRVSPQCIRICRRHLTTDHCGH